MRVIDSKDEFMHEGTRITCQNGPLPHPTHDEVNGPRNLLIREGTHTFLIAGHILEHLADHPHTEGSLEYEEVEECFWVTAHDLGVAGVDFNGDDSLLVPRNDSRETGVHLCPEELHTTSSEPTRVYALTEVLGQQEVLITSMVNGAIDIVC